MRALAALRDTRVLVLAARPTGLRLRNAFRLDVAITGRSKASMLSASLAPTLRNLLAHEVPRGQQILLTTNATTTRRLVNA